MIELRPTQYGDFDKIKIKACYGGDPTLTSRHNSMVQEKGILMHTIVESSTGGVIGVIGFNKIWDGVVRAWAVFGVDVQRYPIAFHKLILRLIEHYTFILKIWRIEITVLCSFNQGIKWAESLGFIREGCMKKFGPDGSDFYLYARVV